MEELKFMTENNKKNENSFHIIALEDEIICLLKEKKYLEQLLSKYIKTIIPIINE